jgi:hypothetical protein
LPFWCRIYYLAGLSGPALQALIAKQIPPDEQGDLQGDVISFISATGIVHSSLITNICACFTGKGVPVQFPRHLFTRHLFSWAQCRYDSHCSVTWVIAKWPQTGAKLWLGDNTGTLVEQDRWQGQCRVLL